MLAQAETCTHHSDLNALHQHFLSILPRIQTHAQIHFRHLRCPGKREDAIQEVVAIAWKAFRRVTEQGKDVDEFVMVLADFAVRHVRAGRRLCGQEKVKDVLSRRAQHQKGFRVEVLASSTCKSHETFYSDPQGQDRMDSFEEYLRDNMQSPVPDQAAFRIDFPTWMASIGDRKRRIAQDLMEGERTLDVAARHGLTEGRISQVRRELMIHWHRYCGEPINA